MGPEDVTLSRRRGTRRNDSHLPHRGHHGVELSAMPDSSIVIRTGGQTGVDRAALLVAIELGIPYVGWCPRDGRADDRQTPPGLLGEFPNLRPTPSTDRRQRTAWNVRDADASLI